MSETHERNEEMLRNPLSQGGGGHALTHSEAEAFLAAYTASELSAAEQAAIEEHIAGCERCEAALNDIRQIRRLLQSLASPATHDSQGKVLSSAPVDPVYPTTSLAENILARLISEGTLLSNQQKSEQAHSGASDSFSRPVFSSPGVEDEVLPLLPRTPMPRQGSGAFSSPAHTTKDGRMTRKNVSQKRVWQQGLALIAALVSVGLLVGGFILALSLFHNGQNTGSYPAKTPLVTAPLLPTLCPAAGMARAAVKPAFVAGNDQNIVYLTSNTQANVITASTLWRYDLATGHTNMIRRLDHVAIDQAQISADGQWILLLSHIGNTQTSEPQVQYRIQLLRIDGQALQTLYCVPKGAGTRAGFLNWSPDGATVAFNEGAPTQTTLKLLDLTTGNVKTALVSTTTAYQPRFWLDQTHLYLTNIVTDFGSPGGSSSVPSISLLDIQKGQNQRGTDLQLVAGGLSICYDFDKIPANSNLFISQCSGLRQPGPSGIAAQPPTGGAKHTLYRSDPYPIIMLRAISSRTLLFLINNHSFGNGNADTSRNGIWKINTDGSGLTHLVGDTSDQQSQLNTYSQSAWANASRDGYLYAYEQDTTTGDSPGAGFFAPLNGGQPTKFAEHASIVGWTTM